MFKLLSERLKDVNGDPEVYNYDKFSMVFRNQIIYIVGDVLGGVAEYYDKLFQEFAREKGIFIDRRLVIGTQGEIKFQKYIQSSQSDDFLDCIDFLFFKFDKKLRGNIDPDLDQTIDHAIDELGKRLKQHNLGYEFVNGTIIRIDNKILHQEVIKPALKLLMEEGFEGAEEEFLKAFDFKRKGENKNAIVEAEKAFESTMKTICEKKAYDFNEKDTAKKLIIILKKNNFFPDYLEKFLNHIADTLIMGLPNVRNATSAHGQGLEVTTVQDELAEYALSLAATNIVLLVSIYKKDK